MKVLIVSRGFPTAQAPLNGIFEWDQALALAQNGAEVAYMALDFRKITEFRPWGVRVYKRQGIDVFELSLPTGIYRRGLPVLQAMCCNLYNKVEKTWGKPQVMHTHFYFMGAIAAKLHQKTGIPWVHTEHSSKLNKPLAAISALDKKLATAALTKANRVVAVSTAYAQVLQQNFGVTAKVVPNVVALDGALLHRMPEGAFTWISVGRLIEGKGMHQLIDAFKELLSVHARAQLRIIGDGPEKENLQKQINQYGLQDKITLLGMLSRAQIIEQLAKAHAFVLLSQSETFGLSYIEAMASGLPVVATNCGGPSYFVRQENGVLVPIGDTVAATQAMLDMMQHYENYNLAQIAAQTKQLFSAKNIADQLQVIYNQLVV